MLKRICQALAITLWLLAVPAQAQIVSFGVAAPQDNGGTCAQAKTFLTRTSGLSSGTRDAYSTYICGLVTDGVITSGASMAPSGGTPYCGTKLDALWVMATEDSASADLDICGHVAYALVPSGAPNFTANQGYVGIDGAVTQVWSASQISSALSGGGTATVTHTGASGIYASVYAATGVSTGKYYWEAKLTAANAGDLLDGYIGYGLGNTSTPPDGIPGGDFSSVGIYIVGTGTKVDLYVGDVPAQGTLTLGFTVANGDVFGFALDLTNNTFWFRDVTQGSGWYGTGAGGDDPATNTNGFSLVQTSFTITALPVVPGALLLTNGDALLGGFGSWAGTPPAGFTGFAPYLNTSFNPATAAGDYTRNSGHLSAWSLTNATSGATGGVIIGNTSSGGIQSNIVAKYLDGNAYGAINTDLAAGNATVANGNSSGYYLISRTASNLQTLYRNGTSIATSATASSALVSAPIYVLARGLPSSSEYGSALRIAIASVGAGLSSADDTALYTRGCTFLTTVHGSC